MWIGGVVAVSGGCYVSGRVVVYVQVRRVRVRDSVVTVRIALIRVPSSVAHSHSKTI